MRVAAVQFKADKGAFGPSLARLSSLCAEAAEGSDLVVLPEMAATGYLFADATAARRVAEPADGPTLAALSPIARASGCAIVCGFPEVDGDRLYNSALIIDGRGALAGCYRKTLLFRADTTWALAGDGGYRVYETPAGRFTVGICMDLNDDRFVDFCRGAGARAIAFPTNWLDDGEPVWPYWAWRLRGVHSALVAANTWGTEEDTRFVGTSAILDTEDSRAIRRRLLDGADAEGDAILRADLP